MGTIGSAFPGPELQEVTLVGWTGSGASLPTPLSRVPARRLASVSDLANRFAIWLEHPRGFARILAGFLFVLPSGMEQPLNSFESARLARLLTFANHAIPLLSGARRKLDSPASDLSQDRRTPYFPDLDTGTSLLHAWVNDFARLPDWVPKRRSCTPGLRHDCIPALGGFTSTNLQG